MNQRPSRNAASKNLTALAVGFALLFLIEGLLHLAGVVPLSREDTFAGFSGGAPLFVPVEKGSTGEYHLNPAKERYFNPQTFSMPKPEGTVRIVAFGGSTTYGRPYLADTAFPTWLSALFQHLDPAHTYESLNAGGISYASYRVRRLVEEMSQFEPDLYIVYSGHNEFLEARTFADLKTERPALRAVRKVAHRSRIYSLLYRGLEPMLRGEAPRTDSSDEVVARLEEIGGPELYHRDPTFRRNVIEQYRQSIEDIVRYCRDRGVGLVLCTVPSNLSGVSPFKSENRDGLPVEKRRKQRRLLSDAEILQGAGDLENALSVSSRALAVDDAYAYAHYLRGRILQRLGRPAEALEAFTRAKEEDIIPLRALDAFNTILRSVSEAQQVPLADIDKRFREESPDGIPGPALFTDHVHPTIKGQQLIAWTIGETIADADLLPVTREIWNRNQDRSMELLADRYEKISPRYRAMGMWGVGRLYHWAGKYPEAYDALRNAWTTVKDVGEIPQLLGELELARNDPEQALRYFEKALRIDPDDSRARYGTVKARLALGDGVGALEALSKVETKPDLSPQFRLFRGEAQLLLGDVTSALEDIEAAAAQAPDVQRFSFSLARARWAAGDEDGSKRAFARYMELTGEKTSPQAFTAFVEATRERLSIETRQPEGR